MNSIPHHAREEFADWLSWRLDGLLRARQPVRVPGLLSITLRLPGFSLPGAPRLQDGDFYWAHPEGGFRLLGRGLALTHRCSGADRLRRLTRHFLHAQAHWRHMDPDRSAVHPLMFTGVAFDPGDPMDDGLWQGFPNSGLFLPELLVRQQKDVCHLVLSCRDGLLDERRQVARWLELAAPILHHEPEHGGRRRSFRNPSRQSVPADAQWLALGRGALEAIEQGLVRKLVLYRRVRLGACAEISAQPLVAAMEAAYPDCRLFAVMRNGRTLVSASPERLAEKRGRRVLSDVLAGTAPRSRDAARDDRLAQSLRDSAKDRLEHRLVEDAVAAALAPLCTRVRIGATPRVQRLRTVQHLWNQVRGVLRGSENLLDVAARLHPTPAVNGSPGPVALDWLRRHGQARRGWYCGYGGWIDRRGDGELAVLLRCALVRDGQADLFAGAGLVSGSEPAAELAETELKLAAVLDALGSVRGHGLV